ncbi:hypothetical protein HDU96_010791 [Phlyctochytrium bullatum]|nr:hypothetical protein HDU96_010791 [Phlyctochytrium bullatum]
MGSTHSTPAAAAAAAEATPATPSFTSSISMMMPHHHMDPYTATGDMPPPDCTCCRSCRHHHQRPTRHLAVLLSLLLSDTRSLLLLFLRRRRSSSHATATPPPHRLLHALHALATAAILALGLARWQHRARLTHLATSLLSHAHRLHKPLHTTAPAIVHSLLTSPPTPLTTAPAAEPNVDVDSDTESSINSSDASVRILDVPTTDDEEDLTDSEPDVATPTPPDIQTATATPADDSFSHIDGGSPREVGATSDVATMPVAGLAIRSVDAVPATTRKPLVVFLYSWNNVLPDEQTDPREAFDALVQAGGDLLDVWLDVLDHPSSSLDGSEKPVPPDYLSLVAVMRKASAVVAFVSDEFIADEDCVKAMRFADQGLDLPVVCVAVGRRPPPDSDDTDKPTDPTWLTSTSVGALVQELGFIDALPGWTPTHTDDLLHALSHPLHLPLRHPSALSQLTTLLASPDTTLPTLLGTHDLRAPDASGTTPLWAAAHAAPLPTLVLLLDALGPTASSEVLRGGSYGRNSEAALHAAAARGDRSVWDALLSRLVFPVHVDDGQGGVRRIDSVRGALVETRDAAGQTAYHVAAAGGHVGLMQAMESLAGEPLHGLRSQDGATALHVAAGAGQGGAVRHLVGTGADVDARDGAETTALHAAAWGCHGQVCRVLLEEGGATVNAQAGDGSTALHLCAAGEGGAEAALETARVLAARPGAATDLEDGEGLTALHMAVSAGNRGVAELLLEVGEGEGVMGAAGRAGLGAGWWEKGDVDGWTALHAAAAAGNEEAVRVLLGTGWGPGMVAARDGEGNTPAHLAASFGRTEALEALLESEMVVARRGSEVVVGVAGWREKRGRNVLHLAVESGEVGCVRAVVEAWGVGCLEVMTEVGEEEEEGPMMPLELAEVCENVEVVEYIRGVLGLGDPDVGEDVEDVEQDVEEEEEEEEDETDG